MRFFGAREQRDQYIPRKGVPRPSWSYRGARRNLARIMHWPERWRFRVWLRNAINAALAKAAKPIIPQT